MTILNHRYCADILLEADTPIKIGSGEKGIVNDELCASDANGLPYIPGTSLAGVLRHSFDDSELIDGVFGFQNGDNGMGSRLILSEARLVGENGEVVDGLIPIDFSKGFYSKFTKLVRRDHCRIDHKGAADKNNKGKFDSQAVYKGCRFVFRIELIGSEKDDVIWNKIIEKLSSPLFRIGSGTRKGFGEFSVKRLDSYTFNLKNKIEVDKYLNRSSKLTIPQTKYQKQNIHTENIVEYELLLKPDDFFSFSSGLGDNEVDSVSKKEIVISWQDGKPKFSEEKILIPASSVKGALAHRTAFYYNKLNGVYADKNCCKAEDVTGENNEAVKELFGYAKNSDKNDNYGQRGKVIIGDVYIDSGKYNEKVFNHVAIDRFTGGSIDGALFDEKVTATHEQIDLKIVVESASIDQKIISSFESAMKDIATGMLPLGGGTMRGHGCFKGKVRKNGEVI